MWKKNPSYWFSALLLFTCSTLQNLTKISNYINNDPSSCTEGQSLPRVGALVCAAVCMCACVCCCTSTCVCVRMCAKKVPIQVGRTPIRICNLNNTMGRDRRALGHETLTLNWAAPCRHKDYPSAHFWSLLIRNVSKMRDEKEKTQFSNFNGSLQMGCQYILIINV